MEQTQEIERKRSRNAFAGLQKYFFRKIEKPPDSASGGRFV
jgi:hypothetical protein